MITQCKYGRFARSCMSVGLCDCGLAEFKDKIEAEGVRDTASNEKARRSRIALESDLRRKGRNNAVYVVRYYGKLVIRDTPSPWPFVRAFSGDAPSKHAVAYIERVTGK